LNFPENQTQRGEVVVDSVIQLLFTVMAKSRKSQEEIAIEAINHALKALRKRHLLEEAAHAPAILALSRPIISQVLHF
jgi:hypothetical protein